MECQLTIALTEQKKEKPASDKLGFGVHFTDHMFVMDYTEGKGWHDPQIVPYSPLTIDPAAMVFHYGQAVFEGLKAYRNKAGEVRLFRPDQNFKRLNRSLARLDMPAVDEAFMIEALKKLVSVEKEWIPTEEGTSLYIRPFVIATEPCFGVRASHTYKLLILLSPVGAYYAAGMKPVKIYVENSYVRAVRGGTGNAKVAGNYAGSLKAQTEAHEKGYEQVLWLDAIETKYIEEVGSMNVFFKVNGEVWTPVLNGSILEGITRDSTIQLLKSWGIPVVEKRIAMEDLFQAYNDGVLEEAFGTGTAAVISPVGEMSWNGHKMVINQSQTGEMTQKLYDTMTGIQYGVLEDKLGWSVKVTE
ncbi:MULTISPECIES: branched-chain amino acid aminotransferase [Brevibacillus]|uniref:Branched-chain-amino-acid aminotransferase n=1 Tax=Brevibacillus invocatus TaxID=173959 RepID=A0A3M8C821_9BACL|nr:MULTISPECIES: branched-chain amino acid aminotransferase [Brevibacillus]MCM3081434.1 branched-chain amino acid aminotransferase [Brevibacillus invocatus]MCM3431790.1 branched-chain amino acid aminotransferase [Brevibacillus invocatus]MDH4619267.1 branched-chain amino acid aminotransferase [Brevibacillus sp. AY1]RNB71537.1 branched-chain amino acid aminotransferase [Brevibacillus invocatus]